MRDYLRFPVYAPDALPAGGVTPAAAPAAPAVPAAAAPAVAQPDPGAAAGAKLEPNFVAGATGAAEPAAGATGPAGATGAGATGAGATGAAGAPAKVEFTDFTVPDGIELDKEAVGEFKTLAGELKLDQAGAQKLVDFYTKAAMTSANAPYKLWEETQIQWQKDIKGDAEIGGANMPTSFANIAKLIDRFGGKEATAIREAFSYTGAGNNPEISRLLARVGKLFAENPSLTGQAPKPATDRASRMYPNQAAKAAS